MHQAILATLSGHEQSARVVSSLKEAGFTADDISVLLPDEFGAQELGFARGSKAPEGIALGAYFGMLLGALLGYIAWEGRTPIVGLENFFIAGPAMASLSMAAIGGIIFGIIGGLLGAVMPEYVAKKYDRKIRFGSSLVSIHVDNGKELKVVENILHAEGAQEVRLTVEDSDRRKPIQLAS